MVFMVDKSIFLLRKVLGSGLASEVVHKNKRFLDFLHALRANSGVVPPTCTLICCCATGRLVK